MDRGESMWGDGSGGSREDEVVGFGDLEKGRGNIVLKLIIGEVFGGEVRSLARNK